MPKILAFIRHEAVLAAGVITAALTFVSSHEQVLAAIIPLVVSLITRTQTSPLSKLEALLKLIGELQTKLKAQPVAKRAAKRPVK